MLRGFRSGGKSCLWRQLKPLKSESQKSFFPYIYHQYTSTNWSSQLSVTAMASEDATKRLASKKQTLDDAYAAPANFLEIDVINPITHGIGNKRYTDYEVRMKVRVIFEWFVVTILIWFDCRQISRCFGSKNQASDVDTVILNGWGMSWKETAK